MMISRPTLPPPPGRLFVPTSFRRRTGLLAMVFTVGLLAIGAMPVAAASSAPAFDADDARFVQTNLVSDQPGMAPLVDPSLVNAWGMSFGPSTPLWVSNNGSDNTTLYNGTASFAKVPLTVAIPDLAPTGQVFNPGPDFMVGGAPAKFIFASEHGFIDAWQGALSPNTMAVQVAAVPNAIYKGLAISTGTGGSWLYAANFAAGRIDVWNGAWAMQNWKGAFKDSSLPHGYAPFNIQNLGGKLYVSYALRGPTGDDVAGPGHGYVDVYSTTGHLLKRLIRRDGLNSPWALQIAPAGFGMFGGDLLVGNFGNGRINAYSLKTGKWQGSLKTDTGATLVIDGLWGLQFGNGVAGTPMTLIFTAGPGGEAHGLLGTLTPAPDVD